MSYMSIGELLIKKFQSEQQATLLREFEDKVLREYMRVRPKPPEPSGAEKVKAAMIAKSQEMTEQMLKDQVGKFSLKVLAFLAKVRIANLDQINAVVLCGAGDFSKLTKFVNVLAEKFYVYEVGDGYYAITSIGDACVQNDNLNT